MDFRNTVEAIVNDKIIEPIRENKLVIRELKENSKNKEIIKFFSSNTPHDFRKLSLPFKNVG